MNTRASISLETLTSLLPWAFCGSNQQNVNSVSVLQSFFSATTTFIGSYPYFFILSDKFCFSVHPENWAISYDLLPCFPGDSNGKNPPAMHKSWVRSLSEEDPLKKEMITPAVFSPGGLCGRRSQVSYRPWVTRVRQDGATSATTTAALSLTSWLSSPQS